MNGSHGPMRRAFIFILILSTLLSACGLPALPIGNQTEPATQATDTPAAAVTPSPTPGVLRTLTVCLGGEPSTLYPFGEPNDPGLSVLAAIDDGPIDTVNYEFQPVILTSLPSLENGDARIVPVTVNAGAKIVDASGTLTALAAGTRVRPSSCRTDDCVITYDGVSALKMDQMQVTYHMRTDVTWSDGTPMTAADSVYGYQLMADPATPGSKVLIDRTQTYEMADPATTQWWSIPGYLDPSFAANFFTPAPKHIWGKYKAAQLPTLDLASRSPVGWGPYKVQEWLAGDHITLLKNPYYFRIAAGYPKFDELVFRFLSDPNQAISELAAGHCDLLDPSVRLDSQVALLQQMQQSGQVLTSITPGMAIEWLGLGIVPATYDDGIQPARNDRPDILADVRTRQGIALCLDRQQVVDKVLFGQSSVPLSFVPPGHPAYNGAAPGYRYDPAAGMQLLNQAGWRDTDGKPETPMLAVSVKGVQAGTPLKLNYFSTPALQRRQVIDILSQSLARCGIGVNVQYYDQNDLYAPGPEGLLFGRRFDLIEYAMATNDVQPPCDWFTSSEVPNALNHWVGTNVSGYQNPDYDAACHAAQSALPGETAYKINYQNVQTIFATELPSIPLYFRLKVAAARAGFCHFELDASANPLWNIEAFDVGPGCK